MLENNSYILRSETVEGFTRYFVSFLDGQGTKQETEVSHDVYLEFLRFVKTERNLKRWAERHIEFSQLSDEEIYKRALQPTTSVEDLTIKNLQDERLRKAIDNLSKTQRRRFTFYYELSFTFEQIAEMERCSKSAVIQTIRVAERNIKQYVNNL